MTGFIMKNSVASVLTTSGTRAVRWRGAVSLKVVKNIDMPMAVNKNRKSRRSDTSAEKIYVGKYTSIWFIIVGHCLNSSHR